MGPSDDFGMVGSIWGLHFRHPSATPFFTSVFPFLRYRIVDDTHIRPTVLPYRHHLGDTAITHEVP